MLWWTAVNLYSSCKLIVRKLYRFLYFGRNFFFSVIKDFLSWHHIYWELCCYLTLYLQPFYLCRHRCNAVIMVEHRRHDGNKQVHISLSLNLDHHGFEDSLDHLWQNTRSQHFLNHFTICPPASAVNCALQILIWTAQKSTLTVPIYEIWTQVVQQAENQTCELMKICFPNGLDHQ